MNDEILQEMIRSSSNAEDVQEFVSRAGLELSDSEMSAATALVEFRAAELPKEASANRRAAFLGRVALQRTQEPEVRRPWNPWIRRMAFAAAGVAALALAAVGGANAGGVTEAVGEALGLRDGHVYHTRSFEPAFRVTIPGGPGGSLAVAVDKSDAFLVGHMWGAPSGSREVSFLFGIYKPRGWADPAGEAVYIIPGDIIAWLQAHPCLDAGKPESPVDIGGVEATQIDAAWTCVPDAHGESTLFYLEGPSNLGPGLHAPAWQSVSIAPGARYRFWVLEVQGEDLVIVAPAPPDSETPCIEGPQQAAGSCMYVPFEGVIRPMLDSLVFE